MKRKRRLRPGPGYATIDAAAAAKSSSYAPEEIIDLGHPVPRREGLNRPTRETIIMSEDVHDSSLANQFDDLDVTTESRPSHPLPPSPSAKTSGYQYTEIIDLAEPLPEKQHRKKNNKHSKPQRHEIPDIPIIDGMPDPFANLGMGDYSGSLPPPLLRHDQHQHQQDLPPPPGAVPIDQWSPQYQHQPQSLEESHHNGPAPFDGNPFQPDPRFNVPGALEIPHNFDPHQRNSYQEGQTADYGYYGHYDAFKGHQSQAQPQSNAPGAFEVPPSLNQQLPQPSSSTEHGERRKRSLRPMQEYPSMANRIDSGSRPPVRLTPTSDHTESPGILRAPMARRGNTSRRDRIVRQEKLEQHYAPRNAQYRVEEQDQDLAAFQRTLSEATQNRERLLQEEADSGDPDFDSLFEVFSNGSMALVATYWQFIDVETTQYKDLLQQKTILHWVAERGLMSAVDKCLKEVVDVQVSLESRDKSGATPLHYACRNGHLNVVQMLLEAGADSLAHDKHGRSPYDYACDALKDEDKPHAEEIQVLLGSIRAHKERRKVALDPT